MLYERSRWVRVRRLDNLLAKPDIVRIVEELDLFLLSYPGFLMVEMVRMVHIYGYRIAVNSRGYRRFTVEKINFLGESKTTIYLFLGLHKGRPSYRRSLHPSKDNKQHLKT